MVRPKLMNSATKEQRLAAFELGVCLNQLRWHRTQALVTACTDELQAVTDALQMLPLLFVKLFPSEDGGELRGSAKEHEKCWRFKLCNGELDREWENIHWDIYHRGFRLPLEDAFLKLQNLVPDYSEHLRQNLLDALGDWPDLRALVNLGSKIDQRRHPPEMYFEDFAHVDQEKKSGMLSTMPATGQRRGFTGDLSFEPPCEWPFRSFPSGTFPPDEIGWHTQLCMVWKNAMSGFSEPESPVTKNANCTEVDEWTERQIDTIKRCLSEPTGEPGNDALSDTQKTLLQALSDLNAIDFKSRQTLKEIVNRAFGNLKDPDSLKRPASDLKKRGLTDSKTGPDGGSWLTAKGKLLVVKAKKNRN